MYVSCMDDEAQALLDQYKQEAQLSPRNRMMRHVS